MHREPFAEIVLSNDAACEQDNDTVNPHGQRFAQRDAPFRSAFGEVGKRTMTRQKGDDSDEQDDRKETYGVVEHIGDGRCSGEFGPVERHAVPAEQDGCRTEQAPDHESDPEAWLTDKILDTCSWEIGHSVLPFSEHERPV